MIKIIDLDKIFDKYIGSYVYKNVGKIKPEEIEDHIPVMYEEFGNEKLSDLNGKTPNEYYKDFPAGELVSALKEHIFSGVPVSDFLLEAIIAAKDAEKFVLLGLKTEENEELLSYLLTVYELAGFNKGTGEILGFVIYDYSENLREHATEILSKTADSVKDAVLEVFDGADDSKKENLAEILSNCKKDDRVLDVLSAEFLRRKDKIAQYAGYLSKYGDERALPLLLSAIEDEKIRYADFTELRFAIESLGGEYEKERDFKNDKDYGKIKGVKKNKII